MFFGNIYLFKKLAEVTSTVKTYFADRYMPVCSMIGAPQAAKTSFV